MSVQSVTTTTTTTTTTTMTEPVSEPQSRLGVVYEIVNNVNDMKYIGSTIMTLERRFTGHKSDCKDISLTSKFYTAMRDIGVEQFSIRCLEVVEYVDVSDLRKREFEFIGMYNKEILYNMNIELGVFSDETRAKISASQTGRTHSAEHRAKMSVATQKGGSIRIRENKHNILYQYRKNGKNSSKCFSYGPRSRITKDQAMILAKAFQRETFPELFTTETETSM